MANAGAATKRLDYGCENKFSGSIGQRADAARLSLSGFSSQIKRNFALRRRQSFALSLHPLPPPSTPFCFEIKIRLILSRSYISPR